jgi:enoyl-CoA hydratase
MQNLKLERIIPTESGDFTIEVDEEGIAHVVLGQPEGMPTTGAAGHAEIGRIWPVLAQAPDVRSILVRSVGKGFCAGGTPGLVEAMLQHESTRLRVMREARAVVQGMLDCDKPIVSAINGAAVGVGAALALLADVSIAARGAKIIDGHTRIGVAAGDHAAVIWPLLCGMAKAKYYLLLSETLSGEEAERIGLVSLCVDSAELEAAALGIARRLAVGSPTALGFTKRALNHWLRAAWPAFEHSLALEMMGFGAADAREGLAALREKRAPRFGLEREGLD